MWWKILIAVLSLILLVSPIDLSPLGIGFDDIGAIIAMVASIASTVKSFKTQRGQKNGSSSSGDGSDGYNDVHYN